LFIVFSVVSILSLESQDLSHPQGQEVMKALSENLGMIWRSPSHLGGIGCTGRRRHHQKNRGVSALAGAGATHSGEKHRQQLPCEPSAQQRVAAVLLSRDKPSRSKF
jgi:hypothetical protein